MGGVLLVERHFLAKQAVEQLVPEASGDAITQNVHVVKSGRGRRRQQERQREQAKIR